MSENSQENNFVDCIVPVDPAAHIMKLYSVPKGMQFIISVDGSPNRLEIVNPLDGRPPFFRMHEVKRVSEKIELVEYEQEDDDDYA